MEEDQLEDEKSLWPMVAQQMINLSRKKLLPGGGDLESYCNFLELVLKNPVPNSKIDREQAIYILSRLKKELAMREEIKRFRRKNC